MHDYDLIIAFRVYPKVSKEPLVFADDKYRLTELGLASLQRSLGTLRVKMYALLDKCPDEYETLVRQYFSHTDLHILRLDGIGNGASFVKQIELLRNDDSAEFVYFAEDDYFYLPDQFPAMLDFMRSSADIDFVTPFDHLDYYTLDLHKHPVFVRSLGEHHWQSRNSTCLTFLARRSSLKEAAPIFATFAKRNYDASIWMSLTKYEVWNWRKIWKFWRTDRFLFSVMAKVWYFSAAQVLFGRRYTLWSPMPSIATHLQNDTIAPAIDWQKEIDVCLAEIRNE